MNYEPMPGETPAQHREKCEACTHVVRLTLIPDGLQVPKGGLFAWGDEYLRRKDAAEFDLARLAIAEHRVGEVEGEKRRLIWEGRPLSQGIPRQCNACGRAMLLENLFVCDGCPCNSPAGVNFAPQPCAICRVEGCVRPGHRLAELFGLSEEVMPEVAQLREALAEQHRQHKDEAKALAAQGEEAVKRAEKAEAALAEEVNQHNATKLRKVQDHEQHLERRSELLERLVKAEAIAEGAAEVVTVETQAIGALAGGMEQALAEGIGYAFALGQAVAQVEDVQLELTHVRARAEGAARETFLKSAGPSQWGETPGFDMQFSNAWAVPLIADSLASMFVGPDAAPNYVEIRMEHAEVGPMVVSVQKVRGKTPHDARKDAERTLEWVRDQYAACRIRRDYLQGERDQLQLQVTGLRRLRAAESAGAAKLVRGVRALKKLVKQLGQMVTDRGQQAKSLDKGWAEKLAAEVESHERTRAELGDTLCVLTGLRTQFDALAEQAGIIVSTWENEDRLTVGQRVWLKRTTPLLPAKVVGSGRVNRPMCTGCNTLVDDREKHVQAGCPGEKRGEALPPAGALHTACVLVRDSIGRVLLIERKDKPGLWALPGGKVEVGEEPRHGALRELEEETGLWLMEERDVRHLFSGAFDGATCHAYMALSPVAPYQVERQTGEGQLRWGSLAELTDPAKTPFSEFYRLMLVELSMDGGLTFTATIGEAPPGKPICDLRREELEASLRTPRDDLGRELGEE